METITTNKQPIQEPTQEPSKKRKPGQKMSPEERAALPIQELVNNDSKFIRRDFGGSTDYVAVFEKKARAWAKENGIGFSDAGYIRLAEFALEMVHQQIDGCRARAMDNNHEVLRRIAMIEHALAEYDGQDDDKFVKVVRDAINGTKYGSNIIF